MKFSKSLRLMASRNLVLCSRRLLIRYTKAMTQFLSAFLQEEMKNEFSLS